MDWDDSFQEYMETGGSLVEVTEILLQMVKNTR